MLLKFLIVVEVHRFLGVLIKEAKLLDITLQFLALETNTVHTTTCFRQQRQLARNGANILGRAVQVAAGHLSLGTQVQSRDGIDLGLAGHKELGCR